MTNDELILRLDDQLLKDQMRRMAAKIIGTEKADDVVQDSLIKMFYKFETFDESKASFNTWAVQIAKNGALHMLREKGIDNFRIDLEDKDGKTYDLPDTVEDEDLTDEINHIASKIIETAHTLTNLTKYGLVDEFINFYSGDNHKTFAELSVEYNLPALTLRTIFRRSIHVINERMIGRSEVKNLKAKPSLTYEERKKILSM